MVASLSSGGSSAVKPRRGMAVLKVRRLSHAMWRTLGFACSTLRTLSSMVCSRSVRVPNLMEVEIRGTPASCSASWHRLTAANTASHSPSMLVP